MNYALKLGTAITALRSMATIADMMKQLSQLFVDKQLAEDDYGDLMAMCENQRSNVRPFDTVASRMPSIANLAKKAGFTSLYAPRKRPRSPDLWASQERRKQLASLNPLPAQLMRKFTIAQQAVLKIVGDEVRRKGVCSLYLGEIAARAGVHLNTARLAIREAALSGLVAIEERKQWRKPNKSNVVRIIAAEWRDWLFSKRYFLMDVFTKAVTAVKNEGGAYKKECRTDKDFLNPNREAATQPHIITEQPSG
jgi:hypothetical protein